MLTLKQNLPKLLIALAEVKASNTSENLLNEVVQMMYYLFREKEITKKVHNNVINLIQL